MADFIFQTDNPNERYESINIGTWNSISDVDTFLSRFRHSNGYKDGDIKLSVGNYVTINDGTYNATWIIAGFDMEHNQTAADGTVYDNGYGICMIPRTYVVTSAFATSKDLTGGYNSSYMNNTVLASIDTNLKSFFGSHIINRNVLLSSSVDGNIRSNAYTWTTAYATLMSIGQMTGTFASNRNKYDDGEANYKLPLFNYESYNIGSRCWSRCIYGIVINDYCVYDIYSDGRISSNNIIFTGSVRPMVYLR